MEMRSSGDGAGHENITYYQQTSEKKHKIVKKYPTLTSYMHVFGPHFFH